MLAGRMLAELAGAASFISIRLLSICIRQRMLAGRMLNELADVMGVCGLKLLVYQALRHSCMRTQAASV